MSTTLTPTGFTAAPVVPQAEGAGQIVGLNLQNTSDSTLQAQPTTFGETFAEGAVQAGDTLTATINGQVYAVQMDAKTFNPDGSVKMAVLTVDAPTLAANSTTGVMISVGGTPDAGIAAPAADLATALHNYALSATLDITANAGGATGVQTVDIGTAVLDALSKGTATMWLNGSLAQEAIVSIPVTGSLRIEADVTAYANGTISADLQFNNDIAMSASGGTITYSATITAGTQVTTQASLTQYQYQDWSTTVGTAPAAGALNVQENIPYLEATGAVPNYDTQYGAASSQISGGNDNEASQIASSGWNAPLGTDGITQYMPGVGGRGDIGPTTSYNALWLITQNATAAEYALGQAQEAGSVPWHFYDPSTTGGSFLSPGTPGEVNIWTDPRGNPGLTQTVNGDTGWATDQAHQPNLTYVAYLQTGNVQYLEQLNAQAAFSLDNQWNPTRQVTTPEGTSYTDIIVNSGEQVRGAAWSLRQIQEAAYANPAGTADGTYFTQVTNDNYAYLVAMIPTWTQDEGQAYGYLVGAYGNIGEMAPWQQDYLASSVIEGAEMGIQNAVTFLKWESNFLVGRFFAESQGFNPANGISYNLNYYNPNDAAGQDPNGPSAFITTWAGISQASVGQSNVSSTGSFTWAHAEGDYGALALQSLAGIITVSTMNAANAATMGAYQYQAMQAFGWLLASGAPYISPNSTAGSTPQFSIDPRLANGQLLSFGNVTISTDTTPTLLTPVDASQNALIYAGSGADTLVGGKGINLLFGGSGSDVIFGGPNGNDIFAGSGNETIVAGGGANFIQASSTALLSAGTGQDLFVVDTQASGSVTISGFNAALDRIDLVDGSGAALSGGAVASIIGAGQSVAGGVVLHVSPTETVTIETGGGATVSAAWFQQQAQALGTVSGASGGSVGGSGGSGASSGGGSTTSPPVQTSIVGGGYVLGGASVFGGSAADSIVAGAGASTVQVGSTGTASVSGGAGAISLIGGAGDFRFQGGSGASFIDQQGSMGNAQIITGDGSATIDAGAGHDYIDISAASVTGTVVINGYSFVRDPINYLGFTGNTYLRSASFDAAGGVLTLVDGQVVQLNYAAAGTVAGSTSSMPVGTGTQAVTLNLAGQSFTGGAGLVILDDNGGNSTITGGSGGLNVTDSKGQDLITTAANSKNILDLSGGDTVRSTGSDLVTMSGGGVVSASGASLGFVGGTGTSTVFGGAGTMSLSGGIGGLDVVAGTGAVSIVQGGGPDQITAGGGNMTLLGGSGTLNFADGGGNTLIDQAAGSAQIDLASGNVTVNAGSGADVFGFSSVSGGGSLTINNANPGAIGFNYGGLKVIGFSSSATVDRMTLSDGTSITMNLKG